MEGQSTLLSVYLLEKKNIIKCIDYDGIDARDTWKGRSLKNNENQEIFLINKLFR
jgi:hypothetical protein